jgi:carbon monoxide dehydrogenase subunit G
MAMHLSASYVFNAPMDRVWALLMDTDRVGGCLPGAKGLKPLGDDRYEAELSVAVAAISGDFKGTIALQDRNPPHSYRLVVEGSGRPGFVKGQALVKLVPGDATTTVQIEADADVGGTIARVGQRLLEGVARMTMDRFYACLAKQAEAS